MREPERRSDTDRAGRRSWPAPHEVDGVADCVTRRTRRRARWRTPPAGEPGRDRGRTNTTADRSGPEPRRAGGGRRRRVRGPGRSSGESGPALGPAGLQHRTTGASAHTRTEPVLAGSAAVVGLIGTLHGYSGRFEANHVPSTTTSIAFDRVRVSRTDLARLGPPCHLCQPPVSNHTDVSCPQHTEMCVVPACGRFFETSSSPTSQVFVTGHTC